MLARERGHRIDTILLIKQSALRYRNRLDNQDPKRVHAYVVGACQIRSASQDAGDEYWNPSQMRQ
jgi:hypothetical protein